MRTVLLVDDDPNIQFAVGSALEEEGYRLLRARDGVRALDVVQRTPPDAIVLDMGLPGLDGFGLCAELERRGLRPSIPVLVVTADGRAQQKAARVSAEAYLAKPF